MAAMSKPKVETALHGWMRENGVSDYLLAKKIGCSPGSVESWRYNWCLPSLVYARKVELATGGAIPMTYWLSTPQGVRDMKPGTDWEKLSSTYRQNSAKRYLKQKAEKELGVADEVP